MKLRTGVVVLFIILAVTAVTIRLIAGSVIANSMPTDKLIADSRAAAALGESDLAFRLLVKGVFYAARPEAFLEAASADDPGIREYLNGILAVRQARWADAERHFAQTARSDSKLLAARARGRLDEMRYKTGVPNADRVPF